MIVALVSASSLKVGFTALQVSDVLICDEGTTFCIVLPELLVLREGVYTSSPPSQIGAQRLHTLWMEHLQISEVRY